MSRSTIGIPVLALCAAGLALTLSARADEMSGSDKLRMLYSPRFTFTRDGLPLLTIELMSGQTQVRLLAERGLRVLPDGEGGPEVMAGSAWVIRAEGARAAKLRYWVVVSRHATDQELALWTQRGYTPRTFETGVVFGVEGDVIDSRELLLGVTSEADRELATKAAKALAEKWKVETFVHTEMVERPRGTLVAREERTGVEVKNAAVLWFAPDGDGGITVKDVLHGGGGSQVGAERRETRRYHGRIYVTLGADGKLTVVNAVPEDQLLAGLVPSEIFPDAHEEALKAQAVAARDELLAKIGTRHFEDPYLLCSSQHCQVYGGIGPEDPRTTRAIKATRGEVLLRDGGGGLVEAYYSASCGGFREHNENIWGTPPDPSLRGRLDTLGADARALSAFSRGIDDGNLRDFLDSSPKATFCGRTRYARDRYRWTVRMPAPKLDTLVAGELDGLGTVKELRPLERGISGRVRRLEIVGSRGRATVEGDLRIRRLFGGLKSTLFQVKREGGEWVFEGAGFGHGVGMCQTGAIGMAESGYNYIKILQHYYPGSHVRRLY